MILTVGGDARKMRWTMASKPPLGSRQPGGGQDRNRTGQDRTGQQGWVVNLGRWFRPWLAGAAGTWATADIRYR